MSSIFEQIKLTKDYDCFTKYYICLSYLNIFWKWCNFTKKLTPPIHFKSFWPSVVFHIEISHLTCIANQMIVFYMKCNTGLKCVNGSSTKFLEPLFYRIAHFSCFPVFVKVTEAALHKCSWEKVFWKYAANLQENTHTEVRFQ